MLSTSVQDTIQHGVQLAKELKRGDVVCLTGDLGAGKTHFTKGIASYFGVDESKVQSPTFTLINEYDGELPIFHFDCYRLKNIQEALEIGAEDYFYGDGISIVEWPEKIKNLLPEHSVWITIKHKSDSTREILRGISNAP
ncbi:MAG: tRNA (adenosine(37)-N6)-threonylcarbamoyltransferase complex ATPase subunit type 1 TsaE [Balneola sp.]|nr:MAG: tRNA (adenosine(37)-N6)-threonylcarbamoyltransferase complex ATPase subunit type 1 TsaE [Balneola sp.]